MKILIIGSNTPSSIENAYIKYFKLKNIEVNSFEAQRIFHEFYYKNILNKILFKLGISGIFNKINKQLIDQVELLKPTIIWVFKGMEITPATLKLFRSKGILLANYNPDNPFIFTGKGSGNGNITSSIHLYNLHFTYNREIQQRITKDYNIETHWLPFGYDINKETLEDASCKNEIIKTCFIGNPDKNRIRFFKSLADQGIKIDIFGNHWGKYLNHENINLFPAIYGNQFWEKLRKYRVQLNPLRIHNLNSHGMRSFEVPGIGGIMLAPRTPEHEYFFKEGEEAFFYDSLEDAVNKINFILSLDAKSAYRIRNSARERSLMSKYSYKDRANEVLGIFSKLGETWNVPKIL